MDLPEGLLEKVKSYLHISWTDEKTDENLTGMIKRGMERLQEIAGAPLDFTVENKAQALLFDYARYANSHALEMFEKNFQSELTDLHIKTQVDLYVQESP
jgi:hypothetical protein